VTRAGAARWAEWALRLSLATAFLSLPALAGNGAPEPGSLLVRVTLPDGRVLGNGGPTGIGGGVPPPATPAPAR